MHRSSDQDLRAWRASAEELSDDEEPSAAPEQRRLLHAGAQGERRRRPRTRVQDRKDVQGRRTLLVACCALLGLGFGYSLAGRWEGGGGKKS